MSLCLLFRKRRGLDSLEGQKYPASCDNAHIPRSCWFLSLIVAQAWDFQVSPAGLETFHAEMCAEEEEEIKLCGAR